MLVLPRTTLKGSPAFAELFCRAHQGVEGPFFSISRSPVDAEVEDGERGEGDDPGDEEPRQVVVVEGVVVVQTHRGRLERDPHHGHVVVGVLTKDIKVQLKTPTHRMSLAIPSQQKPGKFGWVPRNKV